MSIYEIPIEPTSPSFVQETDLDGRTYRFEFRWNSREEEWYLNLRDADDVVVVGGIKLVTGVSLLRHIKEDAAPLGELIVVNNKDDGQSSPTRDDLGSKLLLVYMDAAEISVASTASAVELGGIVVHAEMRLDSSTSLALAIGSWLKYSTGTWVEGLLQDFAVDTTGRITYSGSVSRTFLVNAALTFESSVAGELKVGISTEGQDPGDDEYIRADVGGSVLYPISVTRLVELSANQFVEIFVQGSMVSNLDLLHGQITIIG